MKPGKVDLPTIWRGCDWGPVTLKWKDQNGDPASLYGWQAVAQSLNIDLNPSITDVLGGETTLSLTKAQTAGLKLGREGWDWIWQRPGDQYRFPPFLAGLVEVKEPLSGVNGSQIFLPPPPPDTPEAIAASAIFYNRFHANWLPSARASAYRLDVSRLANFSTFVPGFQNLLVGNVTTFLVGGLDYSTLYHYRVRAHNNGGTTVNSNVINVTTNAPPPPPNDNFGANVLISGLSGRTTGTTVGATTETGEPGGQNSVWFRWRPNAVVIAAMALDTSMGKIDVYTGGAVNALTLVASSVVNGGQSIVTFPTLVNTFYRIRVSKNTDVYPFTLNWAFSL